MAKIPKKTEDFFASLPADIFLRSFLREYSRRVFAGMPYDGDKAATKSSQNLRYCTTRGGAMTSVIPCL